MELIRSLLPFILTTFSLLIFIALMHWILIGRFKSLGNERKFPRQLIMLGLTLVSILIIAFSLPINESSRNQLIALIGLLASGLFAFSSTTVTANLMAGMLIRVTRPFRTGDFIRVGEHFGRVAEMGLFDTEIQAETSELIALPNTYIISNPVSTVRSEGTIISVSLSLGYDIHHSVIDKALIEASTHAGLTEPFVQILELGDHAITYRISGMLLESKGMITARSRLYRAVLDTLHGHGIEIVSPTYIHQRRPGDKPTTIPTPDGIIPQDKATAAEDVAFQKAEQAERTENTKEALSDVLQQLEAKLKEADSDDKVTINQRIDIIRDRLKALKNEDSASKK